MSSAFGFPSWDWFQKRLLRITEVFLGSLLYRAWVSSFAEGRATRTETGLASFRGFGLLRVRLTRAGSL